MDIFMMILEGLSLIVRYLLLFFIPGFVISLVFYPRSGDLGPARRLVYSVILSIGSGIAALVFLMLVAGADTEPGTIVFGLGIFSALLFLAWLVERGYAGSLPEGLHKTLSFRTQEPGKLLSPFLNSRRDTFVHTAMTRVVWHENVPSGTNQVDHTYLIDVGDVIDIQLVDENRWKFSDGGLLTPPYPRTRNFELFIREFREGGSSMIDDLQLYPVRVSRRPGITFLGYTLQRGALAIKERIYKKTDSAEIQWIYTHDFHLFAILYSEDTLGQMVDRVLLKLDEIAFSIHKGSRVASHVEDTQKLRDEFQTVVDKPGVSLQGADTRKPRDESVIRIDRPQVSLQEADTRKPRDESVIRPGRPRVSLQEADTRKPRDESVIRIDRPRVSLQGADTRKPHGESGIAGGKPGVALRGTDAQIRRGISGFVAVPPKIFSPGEDPRKFRDDSRIVFDRSRRAPTITEVPVKNPAPPVLSRPIDSDRRKLQADIVRDLKVDRVTPGTFGKADRMITSIKIPDRNDLQKILLSIKEIQNDAWLYD